MPDALSRLPEAFWDKAGELDVEEGLIRVAVGSLWFIQQKMGQAGQFQILYDWLVNGELNGDEQHLPKIRRIAVNFFAQDGCLWR